MRKQAIAQATGWPRTRKEKEGKQMTRPTFTDQATSDWRGQTMIDRNGDKVGSITDLYADTQTGQPEWALVHTGLFGTKATFVPLAGARFEGDAVRVPHETQTIKDAPRVDPDGQLSQAEEAQLYSHYGLDYSHDPSASGLPTGSAGGTIDWEASAGGRDDAMTRSEEELQVGTAQRERGRVRLRKWVETESVQQSVPLQREEARVEREPITEENIDQAMAGPDITESEHEVILHEEEPVVEKRTVPKERVRLGKEAVTDEEQVSEDLRRERIDTDGLRG
jgi:uncharacterized protein (TIGR02271 family)